jgi:hypothetical protein
MEASFDDQPPPTEVESRLADAWVFLSGRTRDFARFAFPADPCFPPGGRHLLMRATRARRDQPVGVGVVLDRQDAVQIASAMFAVPAEELSEEDINDASREACNVMSGCLTQTLSAGLRLDFDCPLELAATGYSTMWHTSRVMVSFEGRGRDSRVTVTAFDPLSEASYLESAR